MSNLDTILAELDTVHKELLENPYWVAAKDGTFTLNHLKGLIKETYFSTLAIVTNLPMLIVRDFGFDLKTRMKYADYTVEELPDPGRHFVLAKHIGLSEEEIMNHNPMAETKAFSAWRVGLYHWGSLIENRTAAMVSEGFNEKMAHLMVKLLDEKYNIKGEDTGLYALHAVADKEHSEWAARDLGELIKSEKELETCLITMRDFTRISDIRFKSMYEHYA